MDKNRPRYFFAHNAMKYIALMAGKRLTTMALEDQEGFRRMVNDQWKASNVTYEDEYEEYTVELVTKKMKNDKWIILFSTPQPKEVLDTYYCGVVSTSVDNTRYFTVEKRMENRILLCEWTKDGHISYDSIVGNDIKSILEQIEEIYTNVDSNNIFEIINKNEPSRAWKIISNKYKECLAVSEGRENGYVLG